MKLVNLVKATKGNTAMDTTNNIVLAQTVLNNTYSICGKRIASVPISLMELDYSYQRVLGATVNKLMEEWDDDKCDFLIASYRDNKYFIINGQHRYSVAKAKGINSLPCIIFTGLTQSDEALKFAQQQDNVNKLTPYDTFKANIACGNINIPEVRTDVEIKRICDKYNIAVKKYGKMNIGEKVLRCLDEVRAYVSSSTYNGTACFEWIIDTINATNWADCSDSYCKVIIRLLRNHYADNVDCLLEKELMEVMNSISPTDLIIKAKYEYPEYKTTAALGLCLRDMIHEASSNVKGTNANRVTRIA